MTDQAVAIRPEKAGDIMEAVIAKGDLAQLTPIDRARYYRTVCESIGINPLTKPFEYITLNGKLTLYARKDCTDQLRKLYGVSVDEMTEKREADLIIVTVKVRDKTARTDMAKGAVSLKGLAGEALANAIMKAETKAKRRATLSICGLGFLDETEVETISNAHSPRLPKKDARDIYTRLQSEVDEAADIEDWLLKNEGRLLVLPEDWENILRLRIQERQQTPMPVDEVLWTETDDETPPEWQDSKWEDLGPVKQAGVLCGDETFRRFLAEKVAPCDGLDAAVKIVRGLCNVESRAELATNASAASTWRRIVGEYRAWQREPEIIDQASPRPSPSAVDSDGPAITPAIHPPAGPSDVPSAADYHAQWAKMILNATRPDQLGTTWNGQKDLHKQVEWTEDHSYEALKSKVTAAINSMHVS